MLSRLLRLSFALSASVVTAGEIGYTELRTNLPGGRHANVRTMRAVVSKVDGTARRLVGERLADGPDGWTQFAGWSPDGKLAIVAAGRQDPENAKWEEEHKTFRMEPGKWRLDACLVDPATGKVENLTAVERVSHYNGGLFFMPDGRLGFTALIGGVSKPYVMNRDGRAKRDVSGEGGGFAYGYSASPDGKLISYHENYQIRIANADGTGKREIKTGHPFNFGPLWSPDGGHLLFLSGVHHHSDPHVVGRDGSGLRKLVDLGGYRSAVEFLDVHDFHEGSSDLPIWSADGRSILHSSKVGDAVELFRTTLDGESTPLTKSKPGTLHHHPQLSPDGGSLAYGVKLDGVRQIHVMDLATKVERPVTRLEKGRGAMWPHWRPGR